MLTFAKQFHTQSLLQRLTQLDWTGVPQVSPAILTSNPHKNLTKLVIAGQPGARRTEAAATTEHGIVLRLRYSFIIAIAKRQQRALHLGLLLLLFRLLINPPLDLHARAAPPTLELRR